MSERVFCTGVIVTLALAASVTSSIARATPPESVLVVDAPLAFSARPASSGVGTELLAWPQLRVGGLVPLVGPLVAGSDVALSGSYASSGTDVVSVTRFLGGLDARALLGASFGGRFARVVPYGYGGVFGATGPSLVHGGTSNNARLLVVGGARAGVGVLFELGFVGVRGELGGGVLDGRPEATASLGLGVAL